MSCLFRALAYYTPNVQHYQLRSEIANYLSTNPVLGIGSAEYVIHIDSGLTLDQYVNNMRNRSTWGGAIEIIAYAKLYQCTVIVRILQTGKFVEFIGCGTTDCPIVKMYWTGNHYEPDISR